MAEEVENKTLSFNGKLKLVEENGEWYIRNRNSDTLSGPINVAELKFSDGASLQDVQGENLSVDENGVLNASNTSNDPGHYNPTYDSDENGVIDADVNNPSTSSDEIVVGDESAISGYGSNISVDSNGDLTFTDTDTHTDVSDDGSLILEDVDNINLGSNVSVSDDGDGSVTINATDTDTQPVASGKSVTASGDGSSVTFAFSHSLGSVPTSVSFLASTVEARRDFYMSSKTSSEVEITYGTAPPSGTDNLSYELILIE